MKVCWTAPAVYSNYSVESLHDGKAPFWASTWESTLRGSVTIFLIGVWEIRLVRLAVTGQITVLILSSAQGAVRRV